MDKTGRNGLRVGDLLLEDFEDRYKTLRKKHCHMLDSLYDSFEYQIEEQEQQFLDAVCIHADPQAGKY